MKTPACMYLVPAIMLAVLLELAAADLSRAYVWRCHQPDGDIWTSQPPESGDCEEQA